VRDLVITENVTVDGVIDASGGWFAPAEGAADMGDLEEALRVQREAADALLLGRITFEEFRGYWPEQTDDPTGAADYLNAVAKYVVSSTLSDDPGWKNTTVLRGNLADEIRALKSAPGRDIVCTGSVQLARSLIAEDLVDEFRLFTYPVVLGGGRRLFVDAAQVGDLEIAETQRFRSGVVLTRYRT
jgi:dihydrofolate reductase